MDWPPVHDAIAAIAAAGGALGRIGIAALFGAAIGWERESRRRAAGLRTHILVAVGAATFLVLGELLVDIYGARPSTRVDPGRVIHAIVAGVAFIGAGTIFVSHGRRERVQGLTTASSLFVTAAVGIGCGLGAYAIAAGVAVLAVATLRMLAWLEHRWELRRLRRDDGEPSTGRERTARPTCDRRRTCETSARRDREVSRR